MDSSDMFFRSLSLYREEKTSAELVALNEKTTRCGITLTPEQAGKLAEANQFFLKDHSRFEFGKSTVVKIAEKFSGSSFVSKNDYVQLVTDLADYFYEIKNVLGDKVGDDEIIDIMFEYFEKRCGGSTDLLMNRYYESILKFEKIEDCDEREYVPDD